MKFYIKFGENLLKICEISKLILETFESKDFRIIKLDQVEISEINILKKF